MSSNRMFERRVARLYLPLAGVGFISWIGTSTTLLGSGSGQPEMNGFGIAGVVIFCLVIVAASTDSAIESVKEKKRKEELMEVRKKATELAIAELTKSENDAVKAMEVYRSYIASHTDKES